jgi:hypothetical protein
MTFTTFCTWFDVLAHAQALTQLQAHATPIWYQAPLDPNPVRVKILRIYKNNTIRVRPYTGRDSAAFTADAGHLERFRARVPDAPPPQIQKHIDGVPTSRDAGNGWQVLGTLSGTIYIRSGRPVPIEGGCTCDYCKAHPREVPSWDTMAVPLTTHGGSHHTWTVHMPDTREFMERVRAEARAAARK